MMVHMGYGGVHRHGAHLDSGYETILEVVASHLAIGWEVLKALFTGWSQSCESLGERLPLSVTRSATLGPFNTLLQNKMDNQILYPCD